MYCKRMKKTSALNNRTRPKELKEKPFDPRAKEFVNIVL